MRAVEIELQVPCSEGIHTVRVLLESWEHWKVLTSDCIELMGRAFGLMAECHHRTKERGREVKLQAVKQLAKVRAVEHLTQCLADPDRVVRAEACRVLGRIGSPDDPVLVAALSLQVSAGTAGARPALRRLGVEPLSPAEALRTLAGQSRFVRFALVWARTAFVQMGEEALALLKDSYETDDGYIKWAASEVISEIESPRAFPILVGMLTDKDSSVRLNAVHGLVKFGKQAIPPLLVAVRDPHWEVAREALEGITKIVETLQNEEG